MYSDQYKGEIIFAIGITGLTDRKLKPTSSPQTLHLRLSSPLSTDDWETKTINKHQN